MMVEIVRKSGCILLRLMLLTAIVATATAPAIAAFGTGGYQLVDAQQAVSSEGSTIGTGISTGPAGTGSADSTGGAGGVAISGSPINGSTYVDKDSVSGAAYSGYTTPAAQSLNTRFDDVPDSCWASGAIDRLAVLGIANGYPDGAFQPGRAITRDEFASMLCRAFNIPLDANPGFVLKDDALLPGWARAAILTTFKDGIIPGYDDGSFRPDETIPRSELAVIADSALGVRTQMTVRLRPGFADAATIPDWAAGDIAYALAVGIVIGYPDVTFRASQPATRAEACAVVNNLMEFAKSQAGSK
jgi:hypothetical protein